MKKIIAIAAVVHVIATGSALAQQPARLVVGEQIDRPLALREAHTYTFQADSNRFVIGEAVQDGIDLQVVIIGPRGDTIQKFDSPNGANGPEPFQLTTTTRGEHRIVIMPFETATGTGRYTLVLSRVEPVATTLAGKVDQMMANLRGNEPGGIAAVVRNGKVIYQKAWGQANLTHRIPYSAETRTNIGSTSKQFTAFAIVLLAAQNKLSLDDDVRKHIPELPDLGKTVTIRHVLTHTSGYREFLNALAMTGRRIDFGDYIERDEIIELVKRQPVLQNDPGSEFNYNNSGFAIASTIVERVGGKPFPQWMHENVFRPLGMNNTFIRATPGQIIPNSSQGYVAVPGGFREAQDIGASLGAGGIYTTVGDLARWMQNFKTTTVGPAGFFTQMTTRNVLTKGDTSAYGLGLFVDTWRGLRRVHHGGADVAHRSSFVYFPEIDAGVTVQSNNAGFNADQYAARLAEIYFADKLTKPAEAAPVAGAFDPVRFDTTRFANYAGRYEMTAAKGFILSFVRRGNRYYTQATGQQEIEMIPTSDSTFVIRQVNATITFHNEGPGQVKRITLNQNGVHAATRVLDAAPKLDLSAFAGRYFSDEMEAYYVVAVEKDSLFMRNRRTGKIPLTHTRDETFTGTYPIATIKFERDAAGNVTGFRAGSGRTRDVLFRKVD